MPEDVLPCGHLESDVCAGDETVLLDHWVDRLHPAVPEVHPGEGRRKQLVVQVCCLPQFIIYLGIIKNIKSVFSIIK